MPESVWAEYGPDGLVWGIYRAGPPDPVRDGHAIKVIAEDHPDVTGFLRRITQAFQSRPKDAP